MILDKLDLVKKKKFYHNGHMSSFEKFKEKLTSIKTFYSSLTGKKLVIKNKSLFLRFEIHLK